MSVELIGLLGLVALFVLLGLRIPVAFAMFTVGFIGNMILNSPQAAMSQLASTAFACRDRGTCRRAALHPDGQRGHRNRDEP